MKDFSFKLFTNEDFQKIFDLIRDNSVTGKQKNNFFVNHLKIVNSRIFEILLKHRPNDMAFYVFNPTDEIQLDYHFIDESKSQGKQNNKKLSIVYIK